jgi:hypothetical protein
MGHALGNNYGKEYSFLSKPVWVDGNFVVTSTNGQGVTNIKGQGIKSVFMHTSVTPTVGPNGVLNPNPAVGYAWVQLAYNYTKYCGSFIAPQSPATGSALAINATALTLGKPYVIASVGVGALGAATIAPVADVAGSLASTWFRLYDAYGNTFVLWFSIGGVGKAPSNVGGTLVQVSVPANSTAATIGAQLVTIISNLPSGVAGVNSFTASGTTTVTVTNTNAVNNQLPGAPADGLIPTGFAFALTVNDNNIADWQAVGVPKGVVPAIGVSFVAKATGAGASTGTVKAIGSSGIDFIEVVNDPNMSMAPIPMGGSANAGAWILVQFFASTSGTNTALIPTAPADGTVINMNFFVEQASVIVAGE